MADQDGPQTGGMIALIPTAASAGTLVVDGGDPVDQLHLTLAYLGDDVTGLPQSSVDSLMADVAEMADNYSGPVTFTVFAHATFNPNGDNDHDPCAVYLLQQDPRLLRLSEQARIAARDGMGAGAPDQHAFIAHITAGYGLDPSQLTFTGPVTFDRIRLALGADNTDLTLGAPEMKIVPLTADAEGQPQVQVPTYEAGVPVTFPVLAVEGLETSDHRYIQPGALGHRALPVPILAQVQNTGQGGHSGATVVGNIQEMTRLPGPQVIDKETGEPFPDGTYVWSGVGELDPDAKATDLARRGYLTGNSIDLSDMEAEYEFQNQAEMDELFARAEAGDEDAKVAYLEAEAANQRLVVHGAKIAATTLVPIPAFAQAYMVVDGQELAPAADNTALAASAWRSAEVGDDCLLCEIIAAGAQFDADGYAASDAPDAAKRARALKKGLAMPPPPGRPAGEASYPVENADDLDKAVKAVGRGGADHDAIRKHIIGAAKKLGLSSGIPDNWNADGSLKATTASGADEFPSLADFANPQFGQPTAWTVTDDGRCFGHLATWDTCHIGFAGQCVKPPRSFTDYAYFATGAVRARDESGDLRTVAVGHVTMGTGHAPTSMAAKPAAEHYDNTGTCAADVAVGQDQFGIWVAGRARPGTDLAKLRAHALSGDWRPYGGRLELVAALSVNVAGFPVPRARVASGEVVALVAAGAVQQVHANTKDATKVDDLTSNIGQQILDFLTDKLPQLGQPGSDDADPDDQGVDTGGDAVGTSQLYADRDGALAVFGLDDDTRAATALREITLSASPFC